MATFYTNCNASFGDDDAVTDTYTYQAFPLGMYREEDGKGYRFGKVSDADVAVTNGSVVFSLAPATSMWTVTADISDSVANLVVGVAVATVANGSYGWFQTKGYHAVIKTSGADDIAVGESLIAVGDGTVDGIANGTASTYRPVGQCVTADIDADNTVAGWITLE